MIKQIFRPKNKKAIFLCQINEDSLKVIKCLPNNSQRQFISLEIEAIAPALSDKGLTERLNRVFRKLEYNNNSVVISLPRSKATCRYLKVPAQTPKEIERIVSLQASKYLPYSTVELITGYQIISTDNGGYSEVNLVIVHKEIIEHYIKIFQSLNIKNPKIILSSYGLCNLYGYISPKDSGTVMIIEVNSYQAELIIASHKKLLFSRYFKFNRLEPNWRNLFIDEINKTQDVYLKEVSKETPAKIILLGVGKILQELVPVLSKQTALTLETLSYETKINLAGNVADSILNSDDSFASLIGLGLEDAAEPLHLMPQDIKKEIKIASLRKERLRLILYVSLIILVLGLGIMKDLDNKAAYLGRLKAEMDKIAKEAKPLEEIEKRFQLLENRSQKKTTGLDIFYQLHQAVSAGVSLTNFIYEEDRQVVLRGQAYEFNDVSVFVSQLEDFPVFKNFDIKIKYATRKKTQLGEMIDFDIVCSKK